MLTTQSPCGPYTSLTTVYRHGLKPYTAINQRQYRETFNSCSCLGRVQFASHSADKCCVPMGLRVRTRVCACIMHFRNHGRQLRGNPSLILISFCWSNLVGIRSTMWPCTWSLVISQCTMVSYRTSAMQPPCRLHPGVDVSLYVWDHNTSIRGGAIITFAPQYCHKHAPWK